MLTIVTLSILDVVFAYYAATVIYLGTRAFFTSKNADSSITPSEAKASKSK